VHEVRNIIYFVININPFISCIEYRDRLYIKFTNVFFVPDNVSECFM